MIKQIVRTITIKQKPVPVVNPTKICIFKMGAIGDIILTTPMVHALRQRYPKARIDYWVGQWASKALKGNKDVSHVFVFDDATFINKRVDLVIALARQIAAQRYDAMFILDKHWSLGTFGRLCNVPIRIGFDREGEGFAHTITVPFGPAKHEVDYYLQLAYKAGAKKVAQPKLEFELSNEDKQFAKNFFAAHNLNPKKTIGIIPGGAKNPGQELPIKRWPAEYYAIVAQALEKEGWRIILIGRSPGDDDALQIMKETVPNVVSAISNLTLQQSGALMQKCRMIVCNDSGPLHMAAAVGTPTVAIFGPTDPKRWAPRGKNHLWIWNRIECTRAMMYGKYDSPGLRENILKVQPKHVLKAVHKLLKQK
jgi:lipopolysaccharide heptosyltransferase II